MYLYRNIFAEQGLKPEINDQSVSLRNDNVCFLYLPENHSLSIKDFYRSHLLVNRISEKGSIIVKLNSEVLIPEFFYRHLNKQLKEFEKDVRETIDYNTKLKYNLISVDIDYNVIENFISRSEINTKYRELAIYKHNCPNLNEIEIKKIKSCFDRHKIKFDTKLFNKLKLLFHHDQDILSSMEGANLEYQNGNFSITLNEKQLNFSLNENKMQFDDLLFLNTALFRQKSLSR